MPKIKFCPKCNNNFSNYSFVTGKENNKAVNYLVYTCQGCKNEEEVRVINSEEEGVLFSQTNINKLPDREINADMARDPALPHTMNVECPNVECKSNTDDNVKRDVVFFHYNTEMKLAYICTVCRSFWKIR